jgi:hypothetical protein
LRVWSQGSRTFSERSQAIKVLPTQSNLDHVTGQGHNAKDRNVQSSVGVAHTMPPEVSAPLLPISGLPGVLAQPNSNPVLSHHFPLKRVCRGSQLCMGAFFKWS